jgi:hypothetical protein
MLHPSIGMDAAGDATTMTFDEPHDPEQQQQKRHDDDDLFERDDRLDWHGMAPLVAHSRLQRQTPCQNRRHSCRQFLTTCFIYIFLISYGR